MNSKKVQFIWLVFFLFFFTEIKFLRFDLRYGILREIYIVSNIRHGYWGEDIPNRCPIHWIDLDEKFFRMIQFFLSLKRKRFYFIEA